MPGFTGLQEFIYVTDIYIYIYIYIYIEREREREERERELFKCKRKTVYEKEIKPCIPFVD